MLLLLSFHQLYLVPSGLFCNCRSIWFLLRVELKSCKLLLSCVGPVRSEVVFWRSSTHFSSLCLNQDVEKPLDRNLGGRKFLS